MGPVAASGPAATARRARAIAHPAFRLATGGAGFMALLVVTWSVLVLTEAGQGLENLGLVGSTLRADTTRADSLAGLGLMTVVTFGLSMLAAAGIALLRRRPALAVAAVIAMGGSVVLAEVLKVVLPRPALADGPAWLLRNTFPSGSTTVATAIGAGLLVVAPSRLRWMALPASAGLAAFIGQATQVTGWHRASDALGGVLLVLAVTSGVLAVLAARGFAHPDERGLVHRRIHLLMAAGGGTAVLVGALLGLLPVLLPLLRAPDGAAAAFVHLALGFAVAGLTVLAFGALGRLIEPLAFGRAGEVNAGPQADPPSRVEPGG